jgi:Putative peptidoglycan binding domain
MESLAYLYLAQEYENPQDRAIALFNSSVGLTALEHLPKAALGMALLCSSGVGGLSQAAQAQTYSSEGLYPSSVYATNETNESRYVYIQPNDLGYSGYSAIYPCSTAYYPISYDSAAYDSAAYDPGASYPGASGYLPVRPTPVRFNRLSVGDSGSPVSQLQDLLRNAGYFSSPSTGYFGTLTESAVIAFQQDYGLEVDGIAGSETIAALQGRNS